MKVGWKSFPKGKVQRESVRQQDVLLKISWRFLPDDITVACNVRDKLHHKNYFSGLSIAHTAVSAV